MNHESETDQEFRDRREKHQFETKPEIQKLVEQLQLETIFVSWNCDNRARIGAEELLTLLRAVTESGK